MKKEELVGDFRSYTPVAIPTNQYFLEKWHAWIHSKVSNRFKRDKSRINDTAQDIRYRLLAKDFIGRWFYKHLTDDFVDQKQAEKILGLEEGSLIFIGSIPVINDVKRSDSNALWRISDLLKYAAFNYERFYYSIQNHTIDSDKALVLLGKEPGNYNALASLYRQGKLRPAELTEHNCTKQKDCIGCKNGKALLKKKNLSLAHNWEDPNVLDVAAKLRWNDTQLSPFLRNWRKKNRVLCTPDYIMRPPDDKGIDAGLLKYAMIIIDNTVINIFKQMGRNDDIEKTVFNNGVSPQHSDEETTGWESDEYDDRPKRVFCDINASKPIDNFERDSDISSIISRADLTEDELEVIKSIELMELTARQYSEASDIPVLRVHKIHNLAMKKLRKVAGFDQEDDNCDDTDEDYYFYFDEEDYAY